MNAATLAAQIEVARLNDLTSKHTAYTHYYELVRAGVANRYAPTLKARGKQAAEVAELADAFDRDMGEWGSPVRAWRG
jgi:hypothetical protein